VRKHTPLFCVFEELCERDVPRSDAAYFLFQQKGKFRPAGRHPLPMAAKDAKRHSEPRFRNLLLFGEQSARCSPDAANLLRGRRALLFEAAIFQTGHPDYRTNLPRNPLRFSLGIRR
jgi:hypothetical protein